MGVVSLSYSFSLALSLSLSLVLSLFLTMVIIQPIKRPSLSVTIAFHHNYLFWAIIVLEAIPCADHG